MICIAWLSHQTHFLDQSLHHFHLLLATPKTIFQIPISNQGSSISILQFLQNKEKKGITPKQRFLKAEL